MGTIATTKGDLDESLLVRSSGVIDGPEEFRVYVEYRLADEPAIALLRALQFSWVLANEKGRWDVCLVCTGDRSGGHTPSCQLAALLRQADVRGAEVVHRSEAVVFRKRNPFDDVESQDGLILIEENGVRSMCHADMLDKRTGADDTADAYACWVEYRRKGTDAIVHRSVHVMAKRSPFAASAGEGFLSPGLSAAA